MSTTKTKEATHQYAYTSDNPNKPLIAEDESRRIKENNLMKPIYYSFTTDDELLLVEGFIKNKVNKRTGKRIEVKPFFRKKERNTDKHKSPHPTEDGVTVSTHESLLHELAKTCFSENKLFNIKGIQVENPLYKYSPDLQQYYNLLDATAVVISEVEVEKSITLFDDNNNPITKRPDIKLRCYHYYTDSYFDLYIEIAVRHKKSELDKHLFKLNHLNVIEIDISSLIDTSNKISDTSDTESNSTSISPKKFLNILNTIVLLDTTKQTWINNTLETNFSKAAKDINISLIEKCRHRDKQQEGMLAYRCSEDDYRCDGRTIVNYTCFGCKHYIGVLGDYNYIKDVNKFQYDAPPYLVCGRIGLFKPNTFELNIQTGYNNLQLSTTKQHVSLNKEA